MKTAAWTIALFLALMLRPKVVVLTVLAFTHVDVPFGCGKGDAWAIPKLPAT